MRARLERFMYGRYGSDNLSQALSITALVLCVVAMLGDWPALNALAMVLLAAAIFRMFSRRVDARRDENLAFLRLAEKPRQGLNALKLRITQGRTHRFYKCPGCGQTLRVPRGKGKINVKCPKCNASFEKRT